MGPEAAQFDAHRKLLCDRSPYFAAALSGPWTESQGTVSLPEDDPELFRLILQWIYTGALDNLQQPLRPNLVRASIRLYVLAGKLQMQPRKVTNIFGSNSDAFLNLIKRDMQHCRATLSADEVDYIFANTLESSILRRFAVRISAYALQNLSAPIQSYRQNFDNTPDFAMELCKRLLLPPKDNTTDPRGSPLTSPFDKAFGSAFSGFMNPASMFSSAPASSSFSTFGQGNKTAFGNFMSGTTTTAPALPRSSPYAYSGTNRMPTVTANTVPPTPPLPRSSPYAYCTTNSAPTATVNAASTAPTLQTEYFQSIVFSPDIGNYSFEVSEYSSHVRHSATDVA